YHGRFVDFERIWCWPKPVQRPHPPILVGGEGPTVLDRVLAHGDAWFPNYGGDPDALIRRAEELRARADRHIEVQVISVPAKVEVIDRLRAGGITRVVHWLPSTQRGPLEEAVERWEA